MRTISLVFALFLLTQPVDAQRRAIVYTTAESTSFRLTPTDTLMFKPSEPTSEGKVYVFVDPQKTFQPMIGIGGALTDAAAETFAKLPAARQEELLRPAVQDPAHQESDGREREPAQAVRQPLEPAGIHEGQQRHVARRSPAPGLR